MKTSELTGAALDWAVAKCEGFDYFNHQNLARITTSAHSWQPSTNPSQAYPIIFRDGIGTYRLNNVWSAHCPVNGSSIHACCDGLTPLIAAMRCYVASKLGDTVNVPDELMETV